MWKKVPKIFVNTSFILKTLHYRSILDLMLYVYIMNIIFLCFMLRSLRSSSFLSPPIMQ